MFVSLGVKFILVNQNLVTWQDFLRLKIDRYGMFMQMGNAGINKLMRSFPGHYLHFISYTCFMFHVICCGVTKAVRFLSLVRAFFTRPTHFVGRGGSLKYCCPSFSLDALPLSHSCSCSTIIFIVGIRAFHCFVIAARRQWRTHFLRRFSRTTSAHRISLWAGSMQ